ncbi:MAG: D-alanyl-D-alanine carboxypeptidase family protein [Chthonomonas sp.]|nr:D-alanyl-D-alanine carboxypeptidase family protein [Chthonomonas sp.]
MRPRWDRTQGRPEPIAALNRIPERENGEPLLSLAEACPSVRVLRPQVIPWLRASVCAKIEAAAASLPEGVYLSVWDAWRSLDRQRKIYEWMTRCAIEVFGELPPAVLRRRINRWVAPWDQPAPPGHCTGAAVDVALVNDDNEELDVTSPYPRFIAAPTYTLGLTNEAQANRSMLVQAMLAQGFSNCRDEYWHYSYGDAGWAVRVGEPECFYGVAPLPDEFHAAHDELWLQRLLERPNPFLEGK